MERLLADAEKISGIHYDISSLTDVYNAIHVIQEEMHITGTTSDEAKDTIEGSFNSLKASWDNLVTAFASGDSDIGTSIKNVTTNAKIFISNVAPVVKTAVTNIFTAITDQLGITDEIQTAFDTIQEMIDTYAPIIEEAMTNLSDAVAPIVEKIQEITSDTELAEQATSLFKDAFELLVAIIAGAIDTIADIVTNITDLVTWLESGDDAAEALKTTVIALTTAFVAYKAAMTISTLIDAVKTAMTGLTAATLLQEAAQKALNLAMSLNPIGLVVAAIAGLVAAFTYLWNTSETFRNFWILIWEDIKKSFGDTVEVLSQFFTVTIPEKIDTLKKRFSDGVEAIKQFFTDTLPTAISDFVDEIKKLPEKAKKMGKDIIEGLWNGINDMAKWIKEKIEGFGEETLNALKDFFGIASPSKVMRDVIGKNLVLGFADGIDENAKAALDSAANLMNGVQSEFESGLSPKINTKVDMSKIVGGINDEVSVAMSSHNAMSKLSNQANKKEQPIYLTIDGQVVARLMTPYYDNESKRIGTKLATRGAFSV